MNLTNEATKNIKKANQYEPLTESEYATTFSTFVAKSMEYETMPGMLKPIIDEFGGKGVKLMSIGAGTGSFEKSLVEKWGLKLKYFYAIEPNTSHFVELGKTLSSLNIDFEIDQNYFTHDMEFKEMFDVILMSHCLYSIQFPLETMIKAKSLLKPEGKVIIFHHGDKGGYELHSHFLKNASFTQQPLANESITSKDLCNMLKKSGISHQVTDRASGIEVDDFVTKTITPTANDVITFLLQTRYENLSTNLKSELFTLAKERCFKNKDGKYLLENSLSMIQITNH